MGQEAYLSLLSDWDLSTAFTTASKPYLHLRVDIRPTEDSEYPVLWGHCPACDLASWISSKILFEKMAPLLKEQLETHWTAGWQDLWPKGPAQT